MMEEDNTNDFVAHLAKRIHDLEKVVKRRGPANLRYAAIDGGKGISLKDGEGHEVYRVGTDPSTGVTSAEFIGGYPPHRPEPPHVDAGVDQVKVQHSGLDHEGIPAQKNFRRAQIHLSMEEDFEPSIATLATFMEEANGSVTHRIPAGGWWVGVVWESLSGRFSPMSELVLAEIEPPVNTDDIQAVVDEAQELIDSTYADVFVPRMEDLEEGFDAFEVNFGNAVTRLSEAEELIAPLPGRMDATEAKATEAQDRATEASAAAIEANNRAMTRLANGNFENGLDYWAGVNVSVSDTAHSGAQAASLDHGGGHLSPESSFPVVSQQIWELSLYYRGDVAVAFQSVEADTRTALESFDLDGDTTWADSGALRVTVPAGVDMLSFTIAGEDALVDDITLRDVTDVVRLEEAANANRRAAEDALAEATLIRYAVEGEDGESGLKGELRAAQSTLAEKADQSELPALETRLSDAFGADISTALDTAAADATTKAGQARADAEAAAKEYADTQDAAVIAAAATDAQTKADAALAESQVALETYAAEGDNLIRNGSFEHGWEHWGTTAGEIIESDDARSGEHVLAIGQDDANDYPRSNWIATEPGSVYMVEYWAKKLVEGDDPQYLRMYYQERLKDGSEVGDYGANIDGSSNLAYAIDMVEGEWIRLTSYVEVENESAVEIRFSPHVYRTSSRYHVDNMRAVDVTEAQQALNAAKEAQKIANDAHADAGAAQTHAEAAMTRAGEAETNAKTHADNLPKVLHGTTAPSGTAPDGSIWWQHQGSLSGPVIGQWIQVNGSWQSTPIDSEAIANLDVGKLTAGSAAIALAFVQKLLVEFGLFEQIEAIEGWVGDVHLGDGAVTAEKITASREMITKIFGADKAYVIELIAEDLIADNADLISAAIQNLTVTERADLVKVFVGELYAEMGIFEYLQSETAWISDAMVDNLSANKVTVTQEFVAAVGKFLEIEAGMIKSNAFEGSVYTGGTFRGARFESHAAADEGVKMLPTGFVSYGPGGERTFSVDAHDGTVDMTGRARSKITGRPESAILGVSELVNRPGLMLDTGTTDGAQPTIFSTANSVLGIPAGTLYLTSREATLNSSGRGTLMLGQGGDVSLGASFGPNAGTGLHTNNGQVVLRGYSRESYHSDQNFKSGRTVTSTSSASTIAFDVVFGAPAPRGSHIVVASTYSAMSTGHRTGSAGVTQSHASSLRLVLGNRSPSNAGTWSIYWMAQWVI